ncbi:hypothetical protein L1049_028491 [Liquidambar formosana]|uniref:Rx N-terminal domain-containing protein n=1 Tax=Liquidambar formosana TaxID=63359 RepID=A0AAP0RJR9_LIQFO
MAGAAVKFFIQRLGSQLPQETETFAGLEDQIENLMSILKQVGDVCSTEGDAAVRSLVKELRDLIFETDDCIDEFIIQMDNQNGSDRMALAQSFRSELEKLVSSLAETVQRLTELDHSTTIEGEKEEDQKNSNLMDDGESSDSTSSFKLNYKNLPYYLQACLKYCCIFPKDFWIPKGKLIRLLVAQSLIQEKAGTIMEVIAEENINELVRLGILHVVDEHPGNGTKLTVPSPYHEFLVCETQREDFIAATTNSDSSISNTIRYVSIHSDTMNAAPNLNNQRLRSLLLFKNQDTSEVNWNWLNSSGAKFLRVLDLEGTKMQSLPDEVGDLIHLRYLGLKHTDISELPERLGMLRALQTLDIRWCGNLLAILPDGILNLVRLRHLKMFKNSGVCGMKVPAGIGRSKNLLTLTGVHAGGSTARELGNLNQLRRLGVMDVAEENISELFDSIMNMQDLMSLSLEGKYTYPQGTLALVETFTPPPFLTKLRLEGVLERLPNWLGLMERLTKLRLGFSRMNENPSLVLQFLPNLKNLTLWHAYETKQMGKEFCRVGGFPKLEVLSISSSELEEWTEIEEGALPNLKYLHLHNCLQLRLLPEGLQFITTLKQLDLLPLLDDHADRLKPDGGKENYKIRHIPLIRLITMSMLKDLVGKRDS